VATALRGADKLIYDGVDDPEFVRALVRHATEYTKMVGLAIAQTVIGISTYGDPSSGCSLLSPTMFREWSKPYIEEVNSWWRMRDLPLGVPTGIVRYKIELLCQWAKRCFVPRIPTGDIPFRFVR